MFSFGLCSTGVLSKHFCQMINYVNHPEKMDERFTNDIDDARCLGVSRLEYSEIKSMEYAGFYVFVKQLMQYKYKIEFASSITDAMDEIFRCFQSDEYFKLTSIVKNAIVFTSICKDEGIDIKIENWNSKTLSDFNIFNVELPNGIVITVMTNEKGEVSGFAPIDWRFFMSKKT